MFVNELRDALLAHHSWDEPNFEFSVEADDLFVRGSWVDGTDEDPPELLVCCSIDRVDTMSVIAREAVEMWFSELTNDDACDVEVRVVSAHFDSHGDLKDLPLEMGQDVAIYVRIHDYLT